MQRKTWQTEPTLSCRHLSLLQYVLYVLRHHTYRIMTCKLTVSERQDLLDPSSARPPAFTIVQCSWKSSDMSDIYAAAKFRMRDFTILNIIYKAHWTNAWWKWKFFSNTVVTWQYVNPYWETYTEIILCTHPAYGRRCYNLMSSLICWAHTQNDPCIHTELQPLNKLFQRGWKVGKPLSEPI